MEEVIAKKANVLPAFIVLIPLSVGLIACGISCTGLGNSFLNAFYIILGVICLGIIVFALVKYLKQPKYFIVYRDGKLNFADGTSCRPEEVENITVIVSRGRYSMPSAGTLRFTACGREYKFDNVQKAEKAEMRLNELKTYARASG